MYIPQSNSITPAISSDPAKGDENALFSSRKPEELLFTGTPGGANFCYLYHLGIIDSNGKLVPPYENTSLPRIENILLDDIHAMLGSEVAQGTDITVKQLLKHVTSTTKAAGKIEIVGGFLRNLFLNHPEFIQSALKNILDPTQLIISPPVLQTPDCDIRCTFKNITDEETYTLSSELLQHVKKGMGLAFNEKEVIEKKKLYHFDGCNKFGIVTFKGPKNLNYEFLIVKELKRTSLFIHDACRLTINSLIQETKWSILLTSDYGLQPIIDLLTGIVHINKSEDIDHLGWPMLISYYTRGYTSCDREAETTLLKTSCKMNLYELLKNCNKNHHGNDSAAEIALLFNASISVGSEKALIKTFWDKTSTGETFPEHDLLWGIRKLLTEEGVSFELLVNCMQIFALLHLHYPNPNVNLIRHQGGNWIQIKVRKNHLLIPFNIETALERICKENTEPIFRQFYEVWAPLYGPTEQSQLMKYQEILQIDIRKVSEKSQSTPLALTIRTVLQSLDPDTLYFFELCNTLPDVIESVINNPFHVHLLSMLENAFPRSASLFLKAKEFPILEFRTRWILSLAETQDPSLCQLAYQMFVQSKGNYDDSFLVSLIYKLLPRDPFSALNVFNRLKAFQIGAFIKIGNGLAASVEGKVLLDTCYLSKIQQLLQTDFSQACQVITNQQSPFFCNLLLTKECLRLATAGNAGNFHHQFYQLLDILLVISYVRPKFPETQEVKLETCGLILTSLKKIKEEKLIPSNALIARLKNCLPNICKYYSQTNQPKEFYAFILLMKNLDIALSNIPFPKEELTCLIKEIRIYLKGNHLESVAFFQEIVPEMYGEGFAEPFSDEIYAICRNLSKKESTIKSSIELLKKYKINKSEIWSRVFDQLNKSKDKSLRLIALPLLFEHGRCCSSECWYATLQSASQHKNNIIYGLIDKILDKNSSERKLFEESEASPETKTKILHELVYLCLDRVPEKNTVTAHGVRIFNLRFFICNFSERDPELELDLRIIDSLLNIGQLDGLNIIMGMICNRFTELQDPAWFDRTLKTLSQICTSLTRDTKTYEQIRINYQYGINSTDRESQVFFLRLLSFIEKIQEITLRPENKGNPLIMELINHAMPLLIDFGNYSNSDCPLKILNSEDYRTKINPKSFTSHWERLIETRLRMTLIRLQPIVHKNELIFFLENIDKIAEENMAKYMEFVITHFCEFLLKEYKAAEDESFTHIFLDIFKKYDGRMIYLINSLINSNPGTTEKMELICSMIAVNLLTLKMQRKATEGVLNELFDQFMYMTCHSPSLDNTILMKYVTTVIKTSVKNSYFTTDRMVKWIIFHNLQEENFLSEKIVDENYYKATTELFFDFQKINRNEYLVYTLKVFVNIQRFLLKSGYAKLKKGYEYYITLFSNNPELFIVYPRAVQEIEKALMEFKAIAKEEKKMKFYTPIEKAWKETRLKFEPIHK